VRLSHTGAASRQASRRLTAIWQTRDDRFVIRNGDGGARDDAAARIGDRADDGARLCEEGLRHLTTNRPQQAAIQAHGRSECIRAYEGTTAAGRRSCDFQSRAESTAFQAGVLSTHLRAGSSEPRTGSHLALKQLTCFSA